MNEVLRKVVVPQEDVDQCFKFAEDLYKRKAASLKQFGRRSIIRKQNDYIADHVIGKVVELGFKKFLEINFNISFEVNFDIWEDQHVHDNGNDLANISIKGEWKQFSLKTDIKGSRKSAKWLLVEKHKIINFDTKIYVTGILSNIPDGKEFEQNPYKYKDATWEVLIQGYALNKDLVDPITRHGWIEYKKGDLLWSPSILKRCKGKYRNLSHQEFQKLVAKTIESIPDNWNKKIGGRLDCELNFGLPIDWLRNSDLDWKKFSRILQEQSK
jgi:hypothetical protein